jgi:hemolysin III
MYPGERFNGYSHLIGLILAGVGAAWLLRKIYPWDDLQQTGAAVIFATSVVLLYAASTLFHSTRGRAKAFWQRVDHGAIYLLIAGTFTPFALSATSDHWSYAALIAMWTLAATGLWRELRASETMAAPVWPYLVMGWLGVLAALRTALNLEVRAGALLLCGAALYTAGTVFYRNRQGFRHSHGIWHLFVLGGTAVHYISIGAFVL